MPNNLQDLIEELAIANRILGHEKRSRRIRACQRTPSARSERYLMARSRSPLLVEPGDILEYTLDSEPLKTAGCAAVFRTRHSRLKSIRRAAMSRRCATIMRPRSCRFASPANRSCLSSISVPRSARRPVLGPARRIRRYQSSGGQTGGGPLAGPRALGRNSVVLMKRHGATVIGASLRELVSRSIYLCWNADYQFRASLFGELQPLHPGEIELAGAINVMTKCGGADLGILERTLKGERPLAAATQSKSLASPRSKTGANAGQEKIGRRSQNETAALRCPKYRGGHCSRCLPASPDCRAWSGR